MGVQEIDKGTYETCTHLCEEGCGIYAERPGSCQAFECQWLRGALEVDWASDTEMRPDSCGVIFDYQPLTAFGDVFTAWELEPHASESGYPRRIIEGLAEQFLVIVVPRDPGGQKGPGERSFVGPPHLVTQATDLMWSRKAR